MGVSEVLNLVWAVFHPLFKPTASKCQLYQMHRNSLLHFLQSTARSMEEEEEEEEEEDERE